MFQLQVFDQREEELAEIIAEADHETLNRYFSCSGLSDELTIQILRRIIYLGISEEGKGGVFVGIHHLKAAILHCNDAEERLVYCKHLIYLYEEEGREFLEAMAMKHEEIKQIFETE